MEFIKKYPLSVKGAVYNFLIMREGTDALSSFPYPSLNGIRDFAYFCGIRDGYIRTMISREKSEGYIQVFKDQQNVTRYRLFDPELVLGMIKSPYSKSGEGFLLAVFSFPKDYIDKKSIVWETLKNFGFKKIAHNTYINGLINTEKLMNAMKYLDLDDNLYLFTCQDVYQAKLARKIHELFDIENRHKELKVFYQDMKEFLSQPGLTDDELARRIIYSGLIIWDYYSSTESPLPQCYLPKDYAFQNIMEFYKEKSTLQGNKLIEYYAKVNK